MTRFACGVLLGFAAASIPAYAKETIQLPGWVVTRDGAVICNAVMAFPETKVIRCYA